MTTCEEQQPGEAAHVYGHRCLAYALRFGIEPLTASQLELADAAACAAVAALPAKLDVDAARMNDALGQLRSRLQRALAAKRAGLAAAQRAIDALYQNDVDSAAAAVLDASTGSQPASDDDRALRLLRAALTLVMGSQGSQDGNPGHGARLQRPRPILPSGGVALVPDQQPNAPVDPLDPRMAARNSAAIRATVAIDQASRQQGQGSRQPASQPSAPPVQSRF